MNSQEKSTLLNGEIDEETYAKAKPHFRAAFDSVQAAGKDLRDFFRFIVDNFGATVKPYVMRFVQETRDELANAPKGDALSGADRQSMVEGVTMTIPEMAALAREHWAQYPETFRLMVKNKAVQKESEAAAKLTMMEMRTLMLGGATEAEAWEASRELFILVNPKNIYRPDDDESE